MSDLCPKDQRGGTRTLAITLGMIVWMMAAPTLADVTVIGMGPYSCGSWTTDRTSRSGAARQDEQWVLGYMSGAAVWGSNLDPLNGLDGDAVWAWMDNYCRAHPLVPIDNAAAAFVREHPR
jgi:hypothetical protein